MKLLYQSSNRWTVLLILFCTVFSSCKKFIEVEAPVTSVNSVNVYAIDNTAVSVLTGIYAKMANNSIGTSGVTGISLFGDLLADNLKLEFISSVNLRSYYQNDLKASISQSIPAVFWNDFYNYIYVTNAAVEGISASNSLTPAVKQQLLGEAKFMRAFSYFYLVNLYGDVPLIITTDYRSNALMGRTASAKVYEQIISDLKDAQQLLSNNYVDNNIVTTAERIRPNKYAATALLARVYLYTKDYANAEAQATAVINNTSLYGLQTLDNAFLKNTKETIWSLQPVVRQMNTWEGRVFPIPSTGPSSFFGQSSLSSRLLNSFELNDQRLVKWVGGVTVGAAAYKFPYKYKVGNGGAAILENEIVFRLAEQYLIRAEARTQLGTLTGANSAASDLNMIRTRAGLLPTIATTQTTLMDAIADERRHELFAEWGHRWLDLKRTGKLDEVMSIETPLKGGTWQPYKALFPIQQTQLDVNPTMASQQNPGYTL